MRYKRFRYFKYYIFNINIIYFETRLRNKLKSIAKFNMNLHLVLLFNNTRQLIKCIILSIHYVIQNKLFKH